MASNTAHDSDEQKMKRRNYKMSRLTCRTCLFEHKNLTSIFATETGLGVAYSEIISSITGIEILENDGLTEYLCAICKQNAKVAYQYKLQAIKSDQTLREAAADSKPGLDETSVTVKRRETEREHYESKEKTKVEEEIKTEGKTKNKRKCKIDAKIKIKKMEKDFDGIEGEIKNVPIKSEFVEYNDDGYDDRIPSPLGDSQDYYDDFVKEEPKVTEVPLTPQPCETSGDECVSLSALRHQSTVCTKLERVEERSNYCPVCGASFDNALALLQHARTHNRLMSTARDNKSTATELTTMKPPSSTKILTVKKKKKLSQTARLKKRAIMWEKENEELKRTNQEPVAGAEVEHVQDVPDHPRCGICSNVFDTREKLDNHFVTHSGTSVTWCALCDKLFLEPVYLRRHLRTAHRQEEVACSDKMAAAVRTALIGDLVTQRRETSADDLCLFVCPQCGQLTLSAEELLNHNATEHPEFCHRCDQCFKLFCDPERVPNHRRLCVPSERFACPVCRQKFVREQVLRRHMESKHRPGGREDKLLQHTCYICNKMFSKFDTLNKHKYRMHAHKKDGQKYECDICHTRVKDKNYLAKHIWMHSAEYTPPPRQFLCLHCGYRATTSSNLDAHIRRRHTTERPFKCPHCDKAFPRSTDKVAHERTHTGVKPYACQVCGMRFIKSSSRTRHMRVHTGERPYKCSHCDHAFSQSQDLKKHERRHTGEKAHACDTCGDTFSHAKEYRAHRAACNREASSPALVSDPHLALIKSQMQYARSYSQLT